MNFKTLNKETGTDGNFTNEKIAAFLHQHLDEFGDPTEDILKCLEYVFEKGGFVHLGIENDEIKGAVVINETGMSGYIPENILVYIAVNADQRGKGVGTQLMQGALDQCNGNVALHVEPHNPAKKLYERLGFTNKYLEMRYQR